MPDNREVFDGLTFFFMSQKQTILATHRYGAKATFHQVIMAEHMPLVEKLLEQGADVNEVSKGWELCKT